MGHRYLFHLTLSARRHGDKQRYEQLHRRVDAQFPPSVERRSGVKSNDRHLMLHYGLLAYRRGQWYLAVRYLAAAFRALPVTVQTLEAQRIWVLALKECGDLNGARKVLADALRTIKLSLESRDVSMDTDTADLVEAKTVLLPKFRKLAVELGLK